jgi:hypothetical protein
VLAVKAVGKASGLRESRVHETQTRVVDKLKNSDGPTFAKLMTMAERELGASISAVENHRVQILLEYNVSVMDRAITNGARAPDSTLQHLDGLYAYA